MKSLVTLTLLTLLNWAFIGQSYANRADYDKIYPSQSENDQGDTFFSDPSNAFESKGNLLKVTENLGCGNYSCCITRVFDNGILILTNSYGCVELSDKILNDKNIFYVAGRGMDERGSYAFKRTYIFDPATKSYSVTDKDF